MITVGTKVEGNWGATYPNDEGVITGIKGKYATVRWEYESGRVWNCDYAISAFMKPGETTVNGSPIGVFVDV